MIKENNRYRFVYLFIYLYSKENGSNAKTKIKKKGLLLTVPNNENTKPYSLKPPTICRPLMTSVTSSSFPLSSSHGSPSPSSLHSILGWTQSLKSVMHVDMRRREADWRPDLCEASKGTAALMACTQWLGTVIWCRPSKINSSPSSCSWMVEPRSSWRDEMYANSHTCDETPNK